MSSDQQLKELDERQKREAFVASGDGSVSPCPTLLVLAEAMHA